MHVTILATIFCKNIMLVRWARLLKIGYNSDKINSAAFIFKLFYVSRINYILHLHIKTSHKKLRCCAFLKVSAFAANMGLHFFSQMILAELERKLSFYYMQDLISSPWPWNYTNVKIHFYLFLMLNNIS